MKQVMVVLLSFSMIGCGFAQRHPAQAKVYALVGGAAAGVGIGLATRKGICRGMYEGQALYGDDVWG